MCGQDNASYIFPNKPEIDNYYEFLSREESKASLAGMFSCNTGTKRKGERISKKGFDTKLVSRTQENKTNGLRILFALISCESLLLLTLILRYFICTMSNSHAKIRNK